MQVHTAQQQHQLCGARAAKKTSRDFGTFVGLLLFTLVSGNDRNNSASVNEARPALRVTVERGDAPLTWGGHSEQEVIEQGLSDQQRERIHRNIQHNIGALGLDRIDVAPPVCE